MTQGSPGESDPVAPDHARVADLLVLAATHHQAGRLAEAERLYRAVLQRSPFSADAHHNLGVLCMQGRRPVEEALRHFRLAWETDPTHPQYGMSLARALAHAGRAEEARHLLADRQQRAPLHPSLEELLASLAVTAGATGAGSAAAQAVEWKNYLAHFAGRDFAAAEADARALAARHPQDGAVLEALALAMLRQGRAAEALPPMQAASRLRPADADARAALGVILASLGQLPGAETALREAIALRTPFPLAHCALGHVLESMGRLDEAVASYRRTLELEPAHSTAYAALGQILASRRRLDEAEALCREGIAASPSWFEAHRDLGVVLALQGRIAEAAASCRNAVRLRPDDLGVRSALLFNLGYVAGESPQALLAEAMAYGREASRKAGTPFDTWPCPPSPERLRVGLVSADLGEHPVGYFLESVLASTDRGRIEWVAYPAQPSADALSQRLRAGVAGWHCLAGLSDGEAARRIRDDGIHVLLDLSGHTARNRLAVFAWRPAPVQASWLGYFATTGVEQMDYVLADTTGVPPGMHGQFTERIWYLPDTRLCFTPPHTDLPVAPLPALHRGQVTFGCFQALAKVNDDVLSLWSRVLSECSGSRLRLQAASLADERTARALLERLRDRGIDPARVELAGAMSRGDYLAAHAEVDLLLDTFPYPGGTTTCEALWMGVPTVTLAGGSMLARQGASLLCAAGLADWVAQTPDEYVALACAKAGDTGRLARTRAGLRRHVAASPLLDAARFSRHLEDALWGMWRARDGGAEVVAPTG